MSASKKNNFFNKHIEWRWCRIFCVGLANTFAEKGWQVNLVVLNLKDEAYLSRLSDKVNLVVLNVTNARYSTYALLKYIHQNKANLFLVFNYELSVVVVYDANNNI